MNLGLGMGLFNNVAATAGGGGGAFSPSSLSPNFWIEADPAKLYTDAGTTLVSADGQAVAQLNEKSSNARILNDQGDSTIRPLYKAGAGKPYLQLDAVNDRLVSTAAAALTDASGQWWVSAAVYFDDVSGVKVVASLGDGSGQCAQLLRVNAGVVETIAFNAAHGATTDTGATITASTHHVLTARFTTTSLEVFVDGVSGGSTAFSGTGYNASAATFYLGEIAAAGSYFGGRIYGIVQGSGTLSSPNQTSLEAYLAALHP